MPRKFERVNSPNWHFPQLALPQLALPQTGPRPRLKSSNCRYTDHNEILELNYLKRSFEIIFYTIKIEFFPSIFDFLHYLKSYIRDICRFFTRHFKESIFFNVIIMYEYYENIKVLLICNFILHPNN